MSHPETHKNIVTTFVQRWFFSTNNKDIGSFYFLFGAIAGLFCILQIVTEIFSAVHYSAHAELPFSFIEHSTTSVALFSGLPLSPKGGRERFEQFVSDLIVGIVSGVSRELRNILEWVCYFILFLGQLFSFAVCVLVLFPDAVRPFFDYTGALHPNFKLVADMVIYAAVWINVALCKLRLYAPDVASSISNALYAVIEWQKQHILCCNATSETLVSDKEHYGKLAKTSFVASIFSAESILQLVCAGDFWKAFLFLSFFLFSFFSFLVSGAFFIGLSALFEFINLYREFHESLLPHFEHVHAALRVLADTGWQLHISRLTALKEHGAFPEAAKPLDLYVEAALIYYAQRIASVCFRILVIILRINSRRKNKKC